MKLSLQIFSLLLFFVFVNSKVSANLITETSLSSGYQGNLFNDSNSTGDVYTAAGIELKYYPSSAIQLTSGARYSMFSEYSDLSNLTGDLSLTIIPTPEASRFSLALSGSVALRKFGQLYQLYDQVGGTVGGELSYRMARSVYLQSSISYLNNNYTNSDVGSNQGIDISTGLNFSIFGSNSLAFRFEYARRSFDQPAQLAGEISPDQSDIFEITGIRLRYSRPLGERTGINLSVGHRQLHVDNDYTVLGYTIDYLSPWADLWEGPSFSGGLKHFFPKQITTTLAFAYYDKNFVDIVELSELTSETYWRDARDDQLTTASFTIARPITLQNGNQLVPTFNLGYRKNSSTIRFFDYEDLQASFSLKMTF